MLSASSFPNRPQLPTRRAFLGIDLQRDFTDPNGKCHVPNVADFINDIPSVAEIFRQSNDLVIWIKTEFQGKRPIEDTSTGGDCIVLTEESGESDEESEDEAEEDDDVGYRQRNRNASSRAAQQARQKSAAEDPEAFLSGRLRTPQQRCCFPGAAGASFAAPIEAAVQHDYDDIRTKSHYSAFKGTTLQMDLQMNLVTEIFLCGSLTNVSVYATASQAVQMGFRVFLIEDALGYRSEKRHAKAVQIMADLMDVSGTTCAELIDEAIGPKDPETKALVQKVAEEGYAMIQANLKSHTPSTTTPKKNQEGVKSQSSAPAASSSASPGERANEDPPSVQTYTKRDGKENEPHEVEDKDTAHKQSDRKISPKRDTRGTRSTRSKTPSSPNQTTSQIDSAVQESRKRSRPDDPVVDSAVSKAQQLQQHIEETSRAFKRNSPLYHQEEDSSEALSPIKTMIPDSQVEQGATNQIEKPERRNPGPRRTRDANELVLVGPGEPIGQGDSFLIHNLFLPEDVFEVVDREVTWLTMSHKGGSVPRLVAVQGNIGPDGTMPIYRHPVDEQPPLFQFSKAVDLVRKEVEKILGHELNHVLIQKYRDGSDNISEHSDKTLDIDPTSRIANVSLGAQRIMTFRSKKAEPQIGETILESNPDPDLPAGSKTSKRSTQKVVLPHKSLFILGLETNRYWLHGIRPDKRPLNTKDAAELAFGGMRISLTFRKIATYINNRNSAFDMREPFVLGTGILSSSIWELEPKTGDQSPSTGKIWGQGARSKTREDAGSAVRGDQQQNDALISAFSMENQRSESFHWEVVYGRGFDVVNFDVTNLFVPDMDSHNLDDVD